MYGLELEEVQLGRYASHGWPPPVLPMRMGRTSALTSDAKAGAETWLTSQSTPTRHAEQPRCTRTRTPCPSMQTAPYCISASRPATVCRASRRSEYASNTTTDGMLVCDAAKVTNRVLSVGSLSRATMLAHQLDGGKYATYASSRGFTTYTGTMDGVPVSIIATGMVRLVLLCGTEEEPLIDRVR